MKRVGQMFREQLTSNIKTGIDGSSSVFLLSYSNLSGAQINELRKNLKQAGADVFVSKNSVARIALKDLKHEGLAEHITEQTAFVWGNTDSVEISKVLMHFSKDLKQFSVQGGLLEGRMIEKQDVLKLSELPSREVLLAQLLSTIQAPISRLMGAMNAKSRDLLSILKQYSEQKGGN